jgi:outer membrane protein, heavy metal efflux system
VRRRLGSWVSALCFVQLATSGCISTKPDRKYLSEIDAMTGTRIGVPFDVSQLIKDVARDESAPGAEDLELEDAIHRALEHNLSLLASSENACVAQAELAQAGLLPNPSVSLSIQSVSPGGTTQDITLSVLEEINGLLTHGVRVDIGTAQRLEVGIDIAARAFDLAQEVELKYRTLAHLRRARILSERIVEQYGRALSAAEARARVGVVPTPDVNRARLQWEDAKRQQLRFDSQFSRGARELNWLLGISTAPVWRIPAKQVELPVDFPHLPESDRAETIGIAYRLDLLRSQVDVHLAESNVSLARWGFLPETQVGVALEHDETGAKKRGPAFSFVIPIFDPGWVGYQLSLAQLCLARRTKTALEGQVRQDVRSAIAGLQIDLQDVLFFRDRLIPQQEENVHLAEESFRLGNSDLDSLLNTLRDYVGALQSYEESVETYFEDRVACQRAVGLVWGRFEEEARKPSQGAAP